MKEEALTGQRVGETGVSRDKVQERGEDEDDDSAEMGFDTYPPGKISKEQEQWLAGPRGKGSLVPMATSPDKEDTGANGLASSKTAIPDRVQSDKLPASHAAPVAPPVSLYI